MLRHWQQSKAAAHPWAACMHAWGRMGVGGRVGMRRGLTLLVAGRTYLNGRTSLVAERVPGGFVWWSTRQERSNMLHAVVLQRQKRRRMDGALQAGCMLSCRELPRYPDLGVCVCREHFLMKILSLSS